MKESPDFSNAQEYHISRNEWIERAKILGVVLLFAVTGGTSLVLIKSEDAGQRVAGVGGLGIVELGLAGVIYENSQNNKRQNPEIILPKPPSENSGGK